VPLSASNLLITLQLPDPSAVAQGQNNSGTRSATALLTCGLAAGNEEAFRQFQTLYFARLYRFLLVIARGDETKAREALQEAMLRVARHPKRFDDEEAFWCWLAAIGRNAARDAGRKQNRYLSLLARFTQRHEMEPPVNNHENAMTIALEESVCELEMDERLLIEGKYLDGRTVKELSSEAGLSEKAVESRLLRLRRQLRERILKKLKTP
jgi:RNA polymerase sigma-70 factor (ECF subfamily)